MTPEETAWLAGLFEGEGTIFCVVDKRSPTQRPHWQMNIRMTDEDVIRKAHRVTGVGTFTLVGPYARSTKQLYKWSVTSRLQLGQILPQLLPHMGERRAEKMRECLEWCRLEPAHAGPTRGTPWSVARRAAHERAKAARTASS